MHLFGDSFSSFIQYDVLSAYSTQVLGWVLRKHCTQDQTQNPPTPTWYQRRDRLLHQKELQAATLLEGHKSRPVFQSGVSEHKNQKPTEALSATRGFVLRELMDFSVRCMGSPCGSWKVIGQLLCLFDALYSHMVQLLQEPSQLPPSCSLESLNL